MKLWFRKVAKHVWIWIAIEPVHKSVLGIYISEERNMFVAEKFISSLVEKYNRHTECILMMKEHGILLKPATF